MRAIRFHEHGDAEVLRVDEVDRPTAKRGQVLARIEYASVNGLDTLFRSPDDQFMPPYLPWIPGSDFGGIVEAVGEDVDGFEPGDRVAGMALGGFFPGTYAEFVAAPVDRVTHLPDGVGFDEAAAVGHVGMSAWHSLVDHAGLEPMQTLLIHGATGGVGHVAVQLADVMGAEVIATSKAEERREWLRDHGADVTLDYRRDDLRDAILDAATDDEVDVILDAHIDEYLELDLEVLAKDGVILNLEFSDHHGTASFSGRHTRMGNKTEARIQFIGTAHTPDLAGTLASLLRLVEDGDIEVVIDRIFDLEEAEAAQRYYEENSFLGKVLLEP